MRIKNHDVADPPGSTIHAFKKVEYIHVRIRNHEFAYQTASINAINARLVESAHVTKCGY